MGKYDVVKSPYIELETPFTAWEAVKMVLLLPTVPIRLAMIFAAVIGVAVVNSFAIMGCDLEKPLPRWRRRLVEVSCKTSARMLLLCMNYWRPKVVGRDNYKKGQEMGAIGIFNHVSYMDAWVLAWSFCVAGVTFNFMKHVPILGYGLRAMQNIYLPPHNDADITIDTQAKQPKSVAQMIKERASDPKMPMLSMAPEGCLSDGRCLLKFKTGAFVAGCPVVPLQLRYQLVPHNPAWTNIIPFWHPLRLMCQISNKVTLEVLPPYIPSQSEKNDPALYAANVRKLIADKLGVPRVEQDRSHALALVNAQIGVSWDGRRIVDRLGIVDEHGMCDLEPFMPANFKKGKKQD